MAKKLAIVLLLSVTANVVNADCIYDGVSYPEGSVIGPFVCSGGQWVMR
jgi:hypothetical protein